MSTNVRRVLGEPALSLIVSVPLLLLAPSVIFGVVLERANGEAELNVTVPDAAIVVAPEIAPAFVIPPVVLLRPPLTVNPPVEIVVAPPIVCPVVKLLSCPLYATLVNVPVVLILVQLS